MNGAFYIGAIGLNAQERALAVISNNIANINTPAFKRSDVRFSELVERPLLVDARPTDNRMEQNPPLPADMAGVAANGSVRVFQQGDLRQTGKPFDVAVSGNGFIEVLGPGGEVWLWRGGATKVDHDGYLATADGLPLKALIAVPDEATELKISREGIVTVETADSADPREIGRIELAMLRDPASLEPEEGGFYRTRLESETRIVEPGEEGSGVIIQGALEASNVTLSDEMITLLLLQRAYAASAQVVQAGDQLMTIANNLRR